MASFGGRAGWEAALHAAQAPLLGGAGVLLNWNQGKAPGLPVMKTNAKLEYEFMFYHSI